MAQIPVKGDRAAFDTTDYPELHSADLEANAPTIHVPAPTTLGQVLVAVASGNSFKWQLQTQENSISSLLSRIVVYKGEVVTYKGEIVWN